MIKKSLIPTIAALILPITVFAQGDLPPPSGVPAPSMKTLSQIEARTAIPPSPATPIAGPHFTINTKGSYYLTGNITVSTGSAIAITASGVTLDLNGFTISSNAATPIGTAISVIGTGVNIFDGHITGARFINGVSTDQSSHNITVTRVSVQGCQEKGISLQGESTLIDSCVVRTITSTEPFKSFGMTAYIVRNCIATDCANSAISGTTISDSIGKVTATGTAAGSGIAGSVVTNCFGENLGAGIGILGSSQVSNSQGRSETGNAISGDSIQNCEATSAAGTAINGVLVTNCQGVNFTNAVTIIAKVASYCHAKRATSGTGINATNAIGCTVESGSTVTATNKSLGTP